ncbi:MAG: DNA repair protein RadA [Acetobacterales bacterium]
MARAGNRYVCQECGAVHAKWSGRCEACGAWNAIVEEAPVAAGPGRAKARGGRKLELVGLRGPSQMTPRRTTGIGEFDRVCGGGLVPGSAVLVGGDPGIGKSTLLLQVVAALSKRHGVAYFSGEEAVDQIRLRAHRLGVADAPVGLAAATDVADLLATLDGADLPDAVVVDSIQTMFVKELDSAPGTVAQVRASAQALIGAAKSRGFALLLVGHVTKEGAIAGPRVLEHMVDTVLYFEGDRSHQFRVLRATKNRFGATDEIGVFEMTDAGLVEVPNPSALFLAERRGNVAGAAVFAGIEGSRPVLLEIQCLLAPAMGGSPRRAVVGWDSQRLSMVLAVLEARCGYSLAGNDVYLNVAGGLRIAEPAADLTVAAAVLSSLNNQPTPPDAVFFGEIGLSGEIRPVGRTDLRLKEAAKLGFRRAVVPKRRAARGDGRRKGETGAPDGLTVTEIGHLGDLARVIETGAPGPAMVAGHG